MKIVLSMSIVALSFVVCGCSGGAGSDRLKVVPVKGTLFLDGKAHGPAQLILEPVRAETDDPKKIDKRQSVGAKVAADGTFALSTYDTGDGAAPGKYTVRLGSGADAGSTDPAAMMAQMAGGTATQPLTIEIPKGGTDSLEIQLKSAKKRKQRPGAPIGQ